MLDINRFLVGVEAGRGDVGLSLNPGDNFNICTPIDSDIVQECGEDQLFPDFILVRVTENTSTLSLLSLAVLGVASNLKSQLKRFRCKNF
ncbi:MAG: hypothetical protein QNJ42_06520 [Crocosphaera sp.]|nr:hypothetical protein [Crocosphaera sp.]